MKKTIFVIILLVLFSVSYFSQSDETSTFIGFGEDDSKLTNPGEEIEVYYKISQSTLMVEPKIGIFFSEPELNDNVEIDSIMIFDNEGMVVLKAPYDYGLYAIHMYENGDKISNSITLEVVEAGPARITFESSKVIADELLTVFFENAPGNYYDRIDLYKYDDVDNAYSYTYEYLYGGKKGFVEMYLPEEAGIYQLRMFKDDTDEMIAESEPLEIIEVESTYIEEDYSQYTTTLELETNVVYPDESISVKFHDAPGFSTDWIGIYLEGDTDDYIIDWQYTDGSSDGILTFYASYEPGNYVFRFLPQDSFEVIAESEPFAVLDVESTYPVDTSEKVMIRKAVFCESLEDELPVNEKIDFEYSDESVYLWFELGTFKGAHEVKWEWYFPSGEIYDTVYLNIPPAVERGMAQWESLTLWSWIPIKEETEKEPGFWKAYFYIDEELVFAGQFNLVETINP